MPKELLTFEEALHIAWTQSPDAMERILEEMDAAADAKFVTMRDCCRRGVKDDWIKGEMLAYKEIKSNLECPENPGRLPAQ